MADKLDTGRFDRSEDPTVPFQYWNPMSYLKALNEHRERINLPKPGQFDQLNKESKATLLTNYTFDGGRADLTKILSPNFQVMHTFQLGLPGKPSNFNFAAVFANDRTLLHGTMDREGNLQGRVHYNFTPKLVERIQIQVMQKDEHSVFQAETEYDGDDYIVNSKITNPSVTEGTGVFALSYLQSITKNLAAGAEIMVQKPYPKYQEAATSLAIRYTPDDKSVWVAQAQGTNILTASYWRKISSKVDACAELQVLNMPTQGRRDAVCTVGTKYEFASATYRAQMDNTFKLSMLLEEKIAPGFSFLISGDIDYAKGENKFGVGLQLES